MLSKQKEKVKPKFKNSSVISPNYEKWNLKHRNTNFIVNQVLKLNRLANISFLRHSFVERLLKWREAMKQCAWLLMFEKQLLVTGEQRYKFAFSYFCKIRHCFMCNWRKQLRLIARFLGEVVPKVEENFPKGRWLMLTLTVPNVHVSHLRDELKRMSKAWQRLIQRKELRMIKGWVRSTEVTFEKKREGYVHPHYHVLLLVPGYYFNNYYIKHARWVELWQEAMRLKIAPSIRIKPVKTTIDASFLEVVKTFSYSVKSEELEADPELALQYFEQVDKMRFFASGGVLRDYLKPIMDAEDAELDTFAEENDEQEIVSYENQAASWNEKDNEYQRDAKHDGHVKDQTKQAKIDRNQYHLIMESLKNQKKKK